MGPSRPGRRRSVATKPPLSLLGHWPAGPCLGPCRVGMHTINVLCLLNVGRISCFLSTSGNLNVQHLNKKIPILYPFLARSARFRVGFGQSLVLKGRSNDNQPEGLVAPSYPANDVSCNFFSSSTMQLFWPKTWWNQTTMRLRNCSSNRDPATSSLMLSPSRSGRQKVVEIRMNLNLH